MCSRLHGLTSDSDFVIWPSGGMADALVSNTSPERGVGSSPTLATRFMQCEDCSKEHDGQYGSGRFCNVKCARTFSTRAKRSIINEQVSKTLSGKKMGGTFKIGYDPNRKPFTKEEQLRGVVIANEKRQKFYAEASWDALPRKEKYRRILFKQNGLCLCGINEWLGKPLVLEIDHINGNHLDDREENLRYLCPNCHSQTPTFRNRKRS